MKKKMLALGMAIVVLLGMAVPVCAEESHDVNVSFRERAMTDGTIYDVIAYEVEWGNCEISITKFDYYKEVWNPETLTNELGELDYTSFAMDSQSIGFSVTNRSNVDIKVKPYFELAEDLKDVYIDARFSDTFANQVLEKATEGAVGGKADMHLTIFGFGTDENEKKLYDIISNRADKSKKLGTITISVE